MPHSRLWFIWCYHHYFSKIFNCFYQISDARCSNSIIVGYEYHRFLRVLCHSKIFMHYPQNCDFLWIRKIYCIYISKIISIIALNKLVYVNSQQEFEVSEEVKGLDAGRICTETKDQAFLARCL